MASRTAIDGVEFFGLGAGVPVTPWDWSFDLTEGEAAVKLAACPGALRAGCSTRRPGATWTGAAAGDHLGSVAALDAIVAKEPRLALCGHIHESWGERSEIGPTEVVNLGPAGTLLNA